MANRSYLYSTDHLPESSEWETKPALRGISEWNYDIPLVFKLLLTGNPFTVKSSIWDSPEKIAIAGDFQQGFDTLNEYLSELPEAAAPLVSEARAFLCDSANRRKYFILECTEIYTLLDDAPAELNLELLQEIEVLGSIAGVLPIPDVPEASTGDEITTADPLQPYYDLGLGNWSNVLYFQFENDEPQHPDLA